MEDQEWRRSARRHAPLRGNQAANGAISPRPDTRKASLSAHTIASAKKSVDRKNEPQQRGATVAPPSRWKEMRQAVRIKATIDTDDRRAADARIADLCEQDREKVAKLVRRIVEVTTLHENSEQEFDRQKLIFETEIQELRGHVKRDAQDIDELSEQLKAALDKLRGYQERVLVLEESNETEIRGRLETDHTMDLLKLEVDKLRKLVKRQKSEMENKEREQQRKYREEMERIAQELKQTHELLLTERRERLEEKQQALEERIHGSVSPPPGAMNRYDAPVAGTRSPSQVTTAPRPPQLPSPLELSAFLNTSTGELPDKIAEILNEWKARMENALDTTAASIGREAKCMLVVSTACQTEQEDVDIVAERERTRPSATRLLKPRVRDGSSQIDQQCPIHRTLYRCFHQSRSLSLDQTSRLSLSPASQTSSISSTSRQTPHAHHRTDVHDQSVTRALLADFANASALVDGDGSFEDEVESTIALIDGLESSPPHRTPTSLHRQNLPRPRNISLLDSSMLGAVDAMETFNTGPSFHELSPLYAPAMSNGSFHSEESLTTRVERLTQGLQVREQILARVLNAQRSNEPSFLQDVELFNQVKDEYEQQLASGRRRRELLTHTSSADQNEDDIGAQTFEVYDGAALISPSSSSASGHSMSVQEAIERDMRELLREEGLSILHQ